MIDMTHCRETRVAAVVRRLFFRFAVSRGRWEADLTTPRGSGKRDYPTSASGAGRRLSPPAGTQRQRFPVGDDARAFPGLGGAEDPRKAPAQLDRGGQPPLCSKTARMAAASCLGHGEHAEAWGRHACESKRNVGTPVGRVGCRNEPDLAMKRRARARPSSGCTSGWMLRSASPPAYLRRLPSISQSNTVLLPQPFRVRELNRLPPPHQRATCRPNLSSGSRTLSSELQMGISGTSPLPDQRASARSASA